MVTRTGGGLSSRLPQASDRVARAWLTRAAQVGLVIGTTAGAVAITVSIAAADVGARLVRRRARPGAQPTLGLQTTHASIIILNWNGRHLLERGLPSVLAAVRAGDEIIVVDNGSTDDSVAYVHSTFPSVRLVGLPSNLGFSAGNNAGVRAAVNDIVVLLNSDMVVEPDFLGPLVGAVAPAGVFAASAQIFLQDVSRPRQETGRTAAQFTRGTFSLAHLPVDEHATAPEPILWAGGGSTAYDRHKFLALGGLDELYSPAYVEDLALSYAAWKQGWTSVFVPASRVHHEHRGTSRRVFGDAYIDRLISRNQLLFIWRHLSWKYLSRHLVWLPAHAVWLARRHSPAGAAQILTVAFRRLPRVAVARARDLSVRVISDDEVFRRAGESISSEVFRPDTGHADVRVQRGWYPLEQGQAAAFRWTGRRAEALVFVPPPPTRIRVDGYVPEMLLRGVRSVRLRIELEPSVRQTRLFKSPGPFVATIPISAGTAGWRRLVFELDRGMRPAEHGLGADVRELGMQVFDIALSPARTQG